METKAKLLPRLSEDTPTHTARCRSMAEFLLLHRRWAIQCIRVCRTTQTVRVQTSVQRLRKAVPVTVLPNQGVRHTDKAMVPRLLQVLRMEVSPRTRTAKKA